MDEKPGFQDSSSSFKPSAPVHTTTTLTQEQPSKPPGERLANYFENFFKTIVGISTLGASLTFNKIVGFSAPTQSSLETSGHLRASSENLLVLLSVSWLFFVLALAFTSFFASALSLWRPAAVKAFGTEDSEDRAKVLWFASGVSLFLLSLIIVAFLTLSIVVAGFVGAAGWAAVAFTAIFGVLCLGVIIWRSPLKWPFWVQRARSRGHDWEEEHVPGLRIRFHRRQETNVHDEDAYSQHENDRNGTYRPRDQHSTVGEEEGDVLHNNHEDDYEDPYSAEEERLGGGVMRRQQGAPPPQYHRAQPGTTSSPSRVLPAAIQTTPSKSYPKPPRRTARIASDRPLGDAMDEHLSEFAQPPPAIATGTAPPMTTGTMAATQGGSRLSSRPFGRSGSGSGGRYPNLTSGDAGGAGTTRTRSIDNPSRGTYDFSRYSRASTIIPDIVPAGMSNPSPYTYDQSGGRSAGSGRYESGLSGGGATSTKPGYVYDDGVREGLVVGRYD